jgi:hypothetical protein
VNQKHYPQQKAAPCQPRVVLADHEGFETDYGHAPYDQEDADVSVVDVQRFTPDF